MRSNRDRWTKGTKDDTRFTDDALPSVARICATKFRAAISRPKCLFVLSKKTDQTNDSNRMSCCSYCPRRRRRRHPRYRFCSALNHSIAVSYDGKYDVLARKWPLVPSESKKHNRGGKHIEQQSRNERRLRGHSSPGYEVISFLLYPGSLLRCSPACRARQDSYNRLANRVGEPPAPLLCETLREPLSHSKLKCGRNDETITLTSECPRCDASPRVEKKTMRHRLQMTGSEVWR